MRKNKRSSLSLSVNAIVVFVLAFAMLGVGLWFVNEIRKGLGDTTGDVFDISDLKNPPTSDNPITISENINLKRGGSVELDVGFYNVRAQDVADATVGIKECVYNNEDQPGGSASEKVPDGTDPAVPSQLPSITSPSTTVKASEGAGFKIIMKEKGKLIAGTTYVCSLCIYKRGGSCQTAADVYEDLSGTFFLTIAS
jgi:hypothetical protein